LQEYPEELVEKLVQNIDALFLMALVWSVSAGVTQTGRAKFDQFLRLMITQHGSQKGFPSDGTVYDYMFDMQQESGASWVKWMSTCPEFSFDARLPFSEIIVPTVDSVRYTYLLDVLVRNNHHALFTGSTGTGKTVNVQRYLSSLPEKLQPVSMIFSAATTANQTEELLFSKMEKRRKRVYGAPLGKRFVVFVDDLNMPAREKYFAQPPIELLRQWMDHNGWYDRASLEFLNIIDISFIGAMGPPGGGRNPVTNRFLRHFNQIAHTEMDNSSLSGIFTTILKGVLAAQNFAEPIQAMADAAVAATIDVYSTISKELLPTPSKSHYTFNLRDLSKVFQGN